MQFCLPLGTKLVIQDLVCPVFPDCSVDHLWQSDSITAWQIIYATARWHGFKTTVIQFLLSCPQTSLTVLGPWYF